MKEIVAGSLKDSTEELYYVWAGCLVEFNNNPHMSELNRNSAVTVEEIAKKLLLNHLIVQSSTATWKGTWSWVSNKLTGANC